jgi:hypothetical protein
MKRFVITIIVLFVFPVYNMCDAQAILRNIANRARNKVEERVEKKAEEKVDQKVDEEIDKQLDKAIDKDSASVKSGKTEEERDKERARKLMGGLGFNSTPVKIETSYSFTSNIKMEIETFDKKGKSTNKGLYNTFFNDSNDAFAYEVVDQEKRDDQKGMFIFDQKNMASIMLSEDKGEKKGIATGLNLNQASPDSAKIDANVPNGKVKRTGNSKRILGYSCDEYLYQDEKYNTSLWVTKDKVWRTGNLYGSIYKNPAMMNGMPNGFVMEADTKDLQTSELSVMKVIEINEKVNKKFDLSAYEITNLGTLNINQPK